MDDPGHPAEASDVHPDGYLQTEEARAISNSLHPTDCLTSDDHTARSVTPIPPADQLPNTDSSVGSGTPTPSASKPPTTTPSAQPEVSDPTDSTSTPAGAATMSKRQRKRLAKREAFLAQRPALRRAERQRRKEKRAAAAATALAAGGAPPKRPRLAPMSAGSDVRVVIDLSFDDLMTERDLGKCLKQVQRCYAANRRAAQPVQLLLTSMDGESRRLMDINDGWQNWDVRVEREHVLRVLPADTVTYLTSDSEQELQTLQPGRAYVIGGLVDHNHHKGECLRRAQEAGISHARLPIDHFLEMKTRKVLTIDHVFSILLRVSGGSGWQEALQEVLPARKGAVLKEIQCELGQEEAKRMEGEDKTESEAKAGEEDPKGESGETKSAEAESEAGGGATGGGVMSDHGSVRLHRTAAPDSDATHQPLPAAGDGHLDDDLTRAADAKNATATSECPGRGTENGGPSAAADTSSVTCAPGR